MVELATWTSKRINFPRAEMNSPQLWGRSGGGFAEDFSICHRVSITHTSPGPALIHPGSNIWLSWRQFLYLLLSGRAFLPRYISARVAVGTGWDEGLQREVGAPLRDRNLFAAISHRRLRYSQFLCAFIFRNCSEYTWNVVSVTTRRPRDRM